MATFDKQNWWSSGNAFVGWVPAALNGKLLMQLGVGPESSIKDGKSQIPCKPLTALGDAPDCVNGVAPGAVRTRSTAVRFSVRALLTERFGVSAILNRTSGSGEPATWVLPIYLVPNKDGDLIGGLSFSGQVHGGRVTTGVFIGLPFDLKP